jgi:putative hydrolase of the HAD superfamily
MDETRRSYLAGLIRSHSFPLPPSPPPDLPPALAERLYPGGPGDPAGKFPGNSCGRFPSSPIRAVLFDIYGTLFISAAGDIQPGGNGEGAEGIAVPGALPGDWPFRGKELAAYFHSAVRKIHRERASQTPFPEVRVEEIWAAFLRSRAPSAKNPAALPGWRDSPDEGAEELALRFELAVNPVYPMPGLAETLEGLKKAGYILGLISNAQFFTPLLFDAFLGAPPEALGFDPSLLIYSCEAGEAKPSPRLFARALDRLAPRGIGAENCLYVGNDMRNDIYGAASAGCQTALFAGDGRSLRLRETGPSSGENPPPAGPGDPARESILPSAVIRRLTDLLFLPAAGSVVRKGEI